MRSVLGDKVVVPEGKKVVNFSRLIAHNPSAAYLFETVEGRDFTVEDLASLLLERYDVDESTAKEDAKAIAKEWINAGIVEE